MTTKTPAWFDAQYNSRARIPEHLAILQQWSSESARTRRSVPAVLDVPYGNPASAPAANETLDIFRSGQAGNQPQGAPVLVYVHGGYWRALDKRDQSFVALPFVQQGALVVVPNYALCPAVSVRHITLQMVQALAWVYQHITRYGGDPQRIVVAGHSAGGHLAAMLLACDWPAVAPGLPANLVKAAVAVSGVFDLAPLRHAPFLAADLNLTATEARALSPARFAPPASGQLLALVGANESEEFLRQNRLIRQAWGKAVVPVCSTLPGHHHMSVLADLGRRGTLLQQLTWDLLQGTASPLSR
jgi:arylformamidase